MSDAGRAHHVILLGRPVPPAAVAGAAAAIAGVGGNIDAIRRLSDYPVTSFELTVSGAEATGLRSAPGGAVPSWPVAAGMAAAVGGGSEVGSGATRPVPLGRKPRAAPAPRDRPIPSATPNVTARR